MRNVKNMNKYYIDYSSDKQRFTVRKGTSLPLQDIFVASFTGLEDAQKFVNMMNKELENV